MRCTTLLSRCLIILSIVALSACGGGSSSKKSSVDTASTRKVSGTVAKGAPIVNADVEIIGKAGIKVKVTADTNGYFVAKVGNLTPPLLLRATDPSDSKEYFSYILSGEGRVNINQLTTAVLVLADSQAGINTTPQDDMDSLFGQWPTLTNPVDTQVIANGARYLAAELHNSYSSDIANTFNIFNSSFQANTTGFDHVLDQTTLDPYTCSVSSNTLTCDDVDGTTGAYSFDTTDLPNVFLANGTGILYLQNGTDWNYTLSGDISDSGTLTIGPQTRMPLNQSELKVAALQAIANFLNSSSVSLKSVSSISLQTQGTGEAGTTITGNIQGVVSTQSGDRSFSLTFQWVKKA